MTFSEKVKEELVNTEGAADHCRYAELAGLWTGVKEKASENGRVELVFDRDTAAKKVFTLIKKAFNITLWTL